ncbi:MAG: hypothetical protein JWN15_817 [Firmicutes bacterium]|nr:hypothetical protein [Bacillota bacterium]
MNRTDRLLAILLRLQSHGHASAADLARHFEVSRRTILREMGALSTMSVPLEAESGPGGGFRLMRGYFLPPLVFEQAEAWTLLTGVRSLLAHGGVPHRAALVRAADKIAALLPTSSTVRAESGICKAFATCARPSGSSGQTGSAQCIFGGSRATASGRPSCNRMERWCVTYQPTSSLS